MKLKKSFQSGLKGEENDLLRLEIDLQRAFNQLIVFCFEIKTFYHNQNPKHKFSTFLHIHLFPKISLTAFLVFIILLTTKMGNCMRSKNEGDYSDAAIHKHKHHHQHKTEGKIENSPIVDDYHHHSSAGPHKAQTEQEIKSLIFQLFEKYDQNKDGLLNKKECRNMLNQFYTRSRAPQRKITDDELMDFIRATDKNQDRKISKEEFYQFYKGQQ